MESLELMDTLTNTAKQTVMAWLSPAYPIGAYAYSHGLEFEIARGLMRKPGDVFSKIKDLLTSGSGWNDLVLFSKAYQSNSESISEIADLALALAQSRERYEETLSLGKAFAKIYAKTNHSKLESAPLPVIMGFAAAREGIPLDYIIPLYAHNFAANLVSVAVRLVPLGQTEGQKVLFKLFPIIGEISKKIFIPDLCKLRNDCVLADIAAMNHEILETRIFRS